MASSKVFTFPEHPEVDVDTPFSLLSAYLILFSSMICIILDCKICLYVCLFHDTINLYQLLLLYNKQPCKLCGMQQ